MNDLVFKEERPDFISLLEIIKYRCVLWVKMMQEENLRYYLLILVFYN